MRRRVALVALSLAAILSLAVAVARSRSTAPSSPLPSAPSSPPAAPAASPSALPLDLGSLRNVFRFQDEASPPSLRAEAERTQRGPVSANAPSGPRLVGLVRRSGRLLAALSLDGEVELAAAGESAAGVTVLSVTEDAVRVRHPDGTEATLPF